MADERHQALVQAESLFTDGTSLVLFQVAASLAVGGTTGAAATGLVLHGAARFVVLAGGGVLAGMAVSVAAIVVRRRITDPVLETVAALITPYAAFLLGETFHVSGVTAVIVAGLAVGAWRPRITTAQTRLQVHAVYQTLIFLLESVGLQPHRPATAHARPRPDQHRPVAAARARGDRNAHRHPGSVVFPLWAAAQWRRGTRRPDWAVPAVVSWAGTRGVVPLAAALSIPLTTASGAALPQGDLVLVMAAAVIVVSLVVQGFTLEPLARASGLGRAGSTAAPGHEETIARVRLAEAALAHLDELAESNAASDAVIDRFRTSLQTRLGGMPARMDRGPDRERGRLTERELRGELVAAENAELARLFDDGPISNATRQRLQRSLDLELARLIDGQR